METKTIWQKILHIVITILTAIATTLGTTSCMDMRTKKADMLGEQIRSLC